MHKLNLGESLNPRDNNCVKQVNGQIMLNENELTCVVNGNVRIVFIKNAMQEVAKKSKNYEDVAIKNKCCMNILCSMIRNHKRSVNYGIKLKDYRNNWNSSKIPRNFMILTHRAVQADPTFLINLASPRVLQGSCAANFKSCEKHEKIWTILERFCLPTCSTRS